MAELREVLRREMKNAEEAEQLTIEDELNHCIHLTIVILLKLYL